MAPAALHPPIRARRTATPSGPVRSPSLRPCCWSARGARARPHARPRRCTALRSPRGRSARAVHRVRRRLYRVPSPLRPAAPGSSSGCRRCRPRRPPYGPRDVPLPRRGHRDPAVTGVISYPTAPAPHGGWPVVSWAHGTSGLASPCAPSRTRAARVRRHGRRRGHRLHRPRPPRRAAPLPVGPERGPQRHRRGPRRPRPARRPRRPALAGARPLPGRPLGPVHQQLAASYAPELHLLGTVVVCPGLGAGTHLRPRRPGDPGAGRASWRSTACRPTTPRCTHATTCPRRWRPATRSSTPAA